MLISRFDKPILRPRYSHGVAKLENKRTAGLDRQEPSFVAANVVLVEVTAASLFSVDMGYSR